MTETIRKQIVRNAYIAISLDELADILQRYASEIEDHLFELQKSSRYNFTITPARCRNCDFQFRPKIKKPAKCPRCKKSWIVPPRFTIRPV